MKKNHFRAKVGKKIIVPTAALLLSFGVLFSKPLAAMAAESFYAVGQSLTKTTGLNIREAPTTASKSLSKLEPGAYIEVIGASGDFYRVHYAEDGAVGYCHKDYIKLVSEAFGTVATASGTLNLRSRATTDSKVITELDRGTRLPVLNKLENGWIRVVLGKRVGYVSAEYFRLMDEEEEVAPLEEDVRSGIVTLAKSYLGTLYEWGGDVVDNPDSYGFDCSHFTYQVLKQYGLMDYYRTSSVQASDTIPIKREDLKPGDLVFYKNASGKVNHVVLYIGDGLIIGANGGGSETNTPARAKKANAMVKIQSIDYSSRAKSYGRVPGLN